MVWLLFGLAGLGLWLIHQSLLKLPTPPARTPSRTLARLREWLVQTGVPIAPRTFLLISVGGAVLGGLVGHVVLGFLGSPFAELLGLLAGGAAYPLVLRSRHARHRHAILESLPEAIDRLRDSLAGSIPMDIALARLGQDSGPEPLRPGFRQLANELALGVPYAEAIQHWADDLADLTADRMCAALVLHDEVGAERFGQCLDQLSNGLRAELALLDQANSARSKIVFQARILLVLPLVVLLGLRTSQPIATQTFSTPIGQFVLAIAALLLVVGYGVMLYLARLPADERELATR